MVNRKVLWIWRYDGHEKTVQEHVDASGADTICLNTITHQFKETMDYYQQKMNKTVWAWRWPGTKPADGYGWHYFIRDQAAYVSTLIKSGLQGFIVDPESNENKKPNDWAQDEVDGNKLKDLATEFWTTLKGAAKGKNVLFGMTSGNTFPAQESKKLIPWSEFAAPCQALYPQSYWRAWSLDKQTKKEIVKDLYPTPDDAIDAGLKAWQKLGAGKKIIPMAGEIELATKEEIASYAARMAKLNLNELHFYVDNFYEDDNHHGVLADTLQAIKAIQ